MSSVDCLPHDERKRVIWVSDWITRMAGRYGGMVRDAETGKCWDWGQALCRECYGPEWVEIMRTGNIESPSTEDVKRAQQWEGGKWPSWVDREFLNMEGEEDD